MKILRNCPLNHIKAIIISRYLTIKRSWKSILLSILGTCISSCVGVAFYWILFELINPPIAPISYQSFSKDFQYFAFVGDSSNEHASFLEYSLKKLYKRDTKKDPTFLYFKTVDEMQNYIYNHYELNIIFGLDLISDPSNVLILYNGTMNYNAFINTNINKLYSIVLYSEFLWINEYNQSFFQNISSIKTENINNYSDITIKYMMLNENLAKSIFAGFGPFFIVAGLLSSIPLLISQPMIEIRGGIRQYMMQCTLKIVPYWLGTFIIDFIIWIIITMIVWAICNIGMIKLFHDNLFTTWFVLVLQGPSMILFFYCVSFCFSDPLSAPRVMYLIFVFMIFVPLIVNLIINGSNPVGLDWFWSLIPPICLEEILTIVLRNMGYNKLYFNSYWHYKHSMPYMIMQLVDIVIYCLILTIIEYNRKRIQKRLIKHKYLNYDDYFKRIKNNTFLSEEVRTMEEDILNSDDWAVRIKNLSCLFKNNQNKPIAAINDVSLGVKEFSIFGFLGANGSGKTTLIKMITNELPPSSGTIELFGKNIEEIEDEALISICPQFNNHLFEYLTVKEHFKIYSLLFQMKGEITEDIIEDLISGMELNDLEDIPVKELSLGDARKLGIALSFLGPSKLLILDEPTASLDPIARRCVQQMILEHKGEKTFILCTHILDEAEFLCDIIPIIVRGNIGSPQYLTEKFGKEYRIDIELDDYSIDCHRKVNNFFSNELPNAYLNVQRLKSQIYSISDTEINLSELFEKMQNGLDSNNGFSYFSCSSSSLEKVFMEITNQSNSNWPYEHDDEFEENYYTIDDIYDFAYH